MEVGLVLMQMNSTLKVGGGRKVIVKMYNVINFVKYLKAESLCCLAMKTRVGRLWRSFVPRELSLYTHLRDLQSEFYTSTLAL